MLMKKGVDIYYISDRDKEKDLKATQKNLKQQGIPQAKKSHILLKGKDDKSKRITQTKVQKIINLSCYLETIY